MKKRPSVIIMPGKDKPESQGGATFGKIVALFFVLKTFYRDKFPIRSLKSFIKKSGIAICFNPTSNPYDRDLRMEVENASTYLIDVGWKKYQNLKYDESFWKLNGKLRRTLLNFYFNPPAKLERYRIRKTSEIIGHPFLAAAEVVAVDLNIADSALLALLPQVILNTQTGYLKKYQRQGSIVWLLRELYKIGRDQFEVLEQVIKVIQTEVEVFKRKDEENWKKIKKDKSIRKLLNRFGAAKYGYGEFTILSHVRNLAWLGYTVDNILTEIEYWLHALDEVEEAIEKKKAQALAVANTGVVFQTRHGLGLWVKCDDMQIARWLWKIGLVRELGNANLFVDGSMGSWLRLVGFKPRKYNIIVVKRSTGNTAILTRRQSNLNLEHLSYTLNNIDRIRSKNNGPRWIVNEKEAQILNGSPNWRAPRTRVRRNELIKLIRAIL